MMPVFKGFPGPMTLPTISIQTINYYNAKPTLNSPRARIQYDIAQQPRLLEHLPGSLIDLLKAALESHRAALEIEHDSPDLLLYAQIWEKAKTAELT